MSPKKHPHHGSTLDEFLEEEGLTEEVNAIVQKRLLAAQLRDAMQAMRLSEVAMARRMHTSRTVVRSLLDPDNDSATLLTLARAANAVGRKLVVGLEPGRRVVVVGRKANTARTRVVAGSKAGRVVTGAFKKGSSGRRPRKKLHEKKGKRSVPTAG